MTTNLKYDIQISLEVVNRNDEDQDAAYDLEVETQLALMRLVAEVMDMPAHSPSTLVDLLVSVVDRYQELDNRWKNRTLAEAVIDANQGFKQLLIDAQKQQRYHTIRSLRKFIVVLQPRLNH